MSRGGEGVRSVDRVRRPQLSRRLDRGPHKTEAGWRLDRSFWGRGLATEGAAAALRYGFDELGVSRIISIIQPANLASRRVAEKAGLTPRGETRWRGNDVIWYAIDHPTRPAPNPKPETYSVSRNY